MPTPDAARPLSLTDIVDTLVDGGTDGHVGTGEVIDKFGQRGFGPLLFLPAFVAILPVVGALPGVSLLAALFALVMAAQLLFGFSSPWLPKALRERSIPADKLERAIKPARPWLARIERILRPRLLALTEGAARNLTGIAAMIISTAMLLGALLPGLIVPPALAMICLSLGLMTRDGWLILAAYALLIGAAALVFGII